MQPLLQSLPLRSVMDRADQAVTLASMVASSVSLSTRFPVLPGTALLLIALSGTDSLSRCSCKITVPFAGWTV